jgi:hypothetical protein
LRQSILDALEERRPTGKHVAHSGAQLAKAIESPDGQNAVACCIGDFRGSVMDLLLEEAGPACRAERSEAWVCRSPGGRVV